MFNHSDEFKQEEVRIALTSELPRERIGSINREEWRNSNDLSSGN
jgi:hypothetical protein